MAERAGRQLTLAEAYRRFGEVDVRGTSPLYEAVAVAIADAPDALAAIETIDPNKRHPTVVLASLASLFVIVGTFDQIVAFFLCTTLGFIALAAAALIVVRRADPAHADRFQTPGYPLTPVLFVLLVLTVVLMVAIHRPLQALAGIAIVALGAVVARRFRAAGHQPGSNTIT